MRLFLGSVCSQQEEEPGSGEMSRSPLASCQASGQLSEAGAGVPASLLPGSQEAVGGLAP